MFFESNLGVEIGTSCRPHTSPTSVEHLSQAPESFAYEHHGLDGVEGRLRILPRRHSRALQTGLDLMRRQPLIVLGFSPSNAFFTRKRIEIAVCGMARLFGEVNLIVPDTIAAHTYRALGYDERQSQAKAREHGINMKNRCLRAMERAQLEAPAARVRLLDWERDVAALPGYAEAYARVCHLFDTNAAFRADVLEKGYSVLTAKLPAASVTESAVREGIQYLLKEFAYFSLLRTAFGRDVVIPYHQDFTLGYRFCDGGYTAPLPGVGWLIYDIELAGESAMAKGASYAN